VASWEQVGAEAPELADRAKERFDARVHKTMATLRRDGSPRISGVEVTFDRGELWIGGMWGSLKLKDLQRDPRFALHSGTEDPSEDLAPGTAFDAKIAGRALEITDDEVKTSVVTQAPGPFHLFRADITEVVLISIGDPADHLVIDTWHEGRGIGRVERR
jgi:hypothetical protein